MHKLPRQYFQTYQINMPNILELENNPNCKKVEIIQTYLKSKRNEEIRVRQRGDGENFIFTKTLKKRISPIKRIEVEEKIITLRDQQVILDADVAELYGVETKRINEAVSNNPEKFPEGYVLLLTLQEKTEVVEIFDHL